MKMALPTRRTEAWKYSDLAAAMADVAPMAMRADGDVIERLAPSVDEIAVGTGETRVLVETIEAAEWSARAAAAHVAEGGALTRIVWQHGSAGVALSTFRVRLARGARFRQFVLAEGARLARIETHVDSGEGAEVELNGVYMVGAGGHADLTSTITHAAPNAITRQLVKGVARKGGRGVFQGKIEVTRGAQKTDARQHHAGLMLEDGAEIFAKPELIIFADDVSCAHGNAVGALDPEALFYLRARGVPEHEAQALMVEAFLAEAVGESLDETARDEALRRIRRWLGRWLDD